jgi:hypothetical protein
VNYVERTDWSVMMAKFDTDIREWAVKGAEQRLLEIAAEAQSIYRHFPELRHRGKRTGVQDMAAADGGIERGIRPRRRRPQMSADARKRISEAQKARWAKQRGEADAEKGKRGPRKP